MKMISRRLEQLDSSMKAMQVAMEGRLPAQQQPEQQQEEHLPLVAEMMRLPIHSQLHNQRPEVYAQVSRPIKLKFPRFIEGGGGILQLGFLELCSSLAIIIFLKKRES